MPPKIRKGPALAVRLLLLCAFLLSSAAVQSQQHAAPTKARVAEGVYLFSTPPYGDVGLDGNSVVILSKDGVLVFDSNGTPAAAAAVLAEIRKLTTQPVRYLVHSHWHWDHWYGAEVYRKAFPGLQIIAHEKTREIMAGPAIAFNQPGLDSQLPAHIKAVEHQLAAVKAESPDSPEIARLEKHLAHDRFFLDQKRGVRHELADLTFSNSMTVYLGQRAIRVLHHDRAITPGDAYLYLPQEKIVVMGDLLIHPVTFALFCYPAGWIGTLEAIDALDAAILVPGHGAPLRDEAHLKATLDILKREAALAREAKAKGLAVEQAKAAILSDKTVLELRARITGSDAGLNDAFSLYLVDWFVRRVYQEAEGPLDDSIPSMP